MSSQNEEDLQVGVRDDVEEDENKRNKTDFVLWFTKSKFDNQELKWESPWGVGYPGWHIECSSISIKHLGEYMDIHCGGVDNISHIIRMRSRRVNRIWDINGVITGSMSTI